MNFATYPIRQRIYSIERIIVVIDYKRRGSEFRPNPGDYNYSKAAPRKMSVAQWNEKRFQQCFPQLIATVVDADGNTFPLGTQLENVKSEILPKSCAYFCDINVQLLVKSDKIADTIRIHLLQDKIDSTIYNEKALLWWGTFIVVPKLERVLLDSYSLTKLRGYFDTIAEHYNGECRFHTGEDRYLEIPFDPTKASITRDNFLKILG